MRVTPENNKGFTLVELIVVLVILAILAAILVPALLGYIDESKNKDDILTAKAIMSAVQSEMGKCYAKYKDNGSVTGLNLIGEDLTNKKIQGSDDDYNLTNTDFKRRVFEKIGITEDPYLVLFYTKKYVANINDISSTTISSNTSELRDAFTVVSVVYWKEKDSTPFYYNFDSDSWEEGSLYTAEIICRGANKNKLLVGENADYKVNMVLKGHKYDGTFIRIYLLYNGTGKNKITEINELIEKKVGYVCK